MVDTAQNHAHFVEIPTPITLRFLIEPRLSYVRNEFRVPYPRRFVTDFGATLKQQLLHVAVREREVDTTYLLDDKV